MRVELKRGTLNDLFTLKELVSMNYIDTCDKDITQAYITEYIDKTFTIPKLRTYKRRFIILPYVC